MTAAASSTRPPVSVESRSRAVKFRRGLSLLAMSLVVPGSAQIAAGNRRLGRIGLRMWLGLLALAVLTGLLALVARGLLVTVMTTGWVLWLGSFILLGVGLVWVLMLVNAWATARPGSMGGGRGAVFSLIAGVLVASLTFGTWTAAAAMRSSGSLVSTVFAGGGESKSNAGRINVLLIGADSGDDREGTRADTIMVASIDATTGRTVLLGLPRNMEDVPFPDYSPLKKLYPKGYGCPTHECLLNAIYTLGEEHKALYPGVKLPGVQATREAVEEVLGLKLNYFAMVDMQGFVSLVDAVGGVRIDLNKRTPIGGGPNGGYLWIEPKKDLLMDGNLALGIARSRYQSSDYERMVRQRCVLNGMLNQLDPFTVATKFGQLASATEKGLVTDVPSSEINRLAELALKTRQLDTTSVSFTPPLIYPGTPNWALIRQTVKDTIAASEALDKPTPTPSRTTAAASSSKPASSSTSRSTTPTRTTAAPTSTRSSSRPASSAAPTVDPSENAPIDPTTICVAR